MRDFAGLIQRATQLVGTRFRTRQGGNGQSATMAQVRSSIAEAVQQGAAARQCFTSRVQVEIDEIDAPLAQQAPTGAAVGELRTWARRMIVRSTTSPRAVCVVIFHRQSAPSPGPRTPAERFPVVFLVGQIDTESVRQVLAVPDAEQFLPTLNFAPDGRIVVDRERCSTSMTPAEAQMLSIGAATAPAAQARAAHEVMTEHADGLDEMLSQITRDPRVAMLLSDWVSASLR